MNEQTANIFEKADRLKLKFHTLSSSFTALELWDLSTPQIKEVLIRYLVALRNIGPDRPSDFKRSRYLLDRIEEEINWLLGVPELPKVTGGWESLETHRQICFHVLNSKLNYPTSLAKSLEEVRIV